MISTISLADDKRWSKHCAPQQINPSLPLLKEKKDLVPQAVYIEADRGQLNSSGVSELSGNVSIRQDSKSILAGEAIYDRPNNLVTATNNVRLETATTEITSDAIRFQLDTEEADIKNVTYALKNGDGNGKSDRLLQSGKESTSLKNASFSTCPPEQQSWSLHSKNITLDHQKEIGVARNVQLKVGKTPIFYLPYFDFPLNNQRKSGFLAPRLGISEQSGTVISLPYYFNLAPNYDLTLTPNILTKRGVKLDSEFRYLLEEHTGTIELDILPGDNERNDTDRSFTSIQHQSKLSDNTQLTIDASNVSDIDYFDDLGDSLDVSSTAALERKLELVRTQESWTLSATLQDFQIIDSTSTTYSRLPELSLRYNPEKGFFNTQNTFEAELVNFHRNDNSTNGARLDLLGSTSKRFGDASWFVEPSLQLRHTQYSLDNATNINNSPSRTLPTASIDSGLFLERMLGNKQTLQTLEPRLLYTYTPFRDQSDIPVFDSAATSFGTSTQLFSTNRFTGKDRIGDTNQLTTALTTRFIDTKAGRENFSASIGQIFYFDDRRVTLPGFTTETNSTSELALELAGNVGRHTRFISSTYWDTDNNQISLNENRIHYSDEKNRIANIVYRNLEGEFEQAQLSFSTPLNAEWSMVGNYERDLQNDRDLEALAGFEYTSCCWKARLVGRRYLTSDNQTYDTATFLEFELKGLGNIGTGAQNVLKEQIYGYEE